MIQWFNKQMSKKRKGFTLIELIVVVAILGILAAIAIPRFTGTMDNAKQKTNEANLRTIESAVAVYAAETGIEAADVDDIGDLIGDYLVDIPTDPWSPAVDPAYEVTGGRASYIGNGDADITQLGS